MLAILTEVRYQRTYHYGSFPFSDVEVSWR